MLHYSSLFLWRWRVGITYVFRLQFSILFCSKFHLDRLEYVTEGIQCCGKVFLGIPFDWYKSRFWCACVCVHIYWIHAKNMFIWTRSLNIIWGKKRIPKGLYGLRISSSTSPSFYVSVNCHYYFVVFAIENFFLFLLRLKSVCTKRFLQSLLLIQSTWLFLMTILPLLALKSLR